ncbi:MAG: CPBP family intramembrane metalloprotease [Flavobacteriaceae bacterium]|nr:CPBP family intramembrane metalloprotease [Flavobacteriaceae bacterium]
MRDIISSIWFMGLATLLLLPLLALPILYFSDTSFLGLFTLGDSSIFSIIFFISAGIFFGLFIMWFGDLPFFKNTLVVYSKMITNLKINTKQAFFLSICAGVGEEILFRGALQPILGIWLTSIIFVGSHHYLYNEKFSKQNTIPFIVMVSFLLGLGLLLGWIAEEFTLWHAIAIHFSYDLVQFMYIREPN